MSETQPTAGPGGSLIIPALALPPELPELAVARHRDGSPFGVVRLMPGAVLHVDTAAAARGYEAAFSRLAAMLDAAEEGR